jgi:opacity protein-like surface antigen
MSLIALNSYSQVSFGPKAGLVLTTIEGSEPGQYETKSKFSFYGGGFLEYKISKFAMDLDVNFAVEGSKGKNRYQQNFDDAPLFFDSTLNIYAVNFNFTGKYYVLDDFVLKGGAYYGTIIKVKYEVDGGSLFNGRQDVSDSFEKSDYGLVVGTEYNLTDKFFIEAKYALGLKNIRKDDPIAGEIELKNRVLFIGVGYKIN